MTNRHMKYFYGILMSAFIFTSCGTMRINRTSDFAAIKDIKEINGNYLNRGNKGSILLCFNIREYADFVTIVAENSSEIKLTYYNDSIKQERVFVGQMRKKYWEIYFSKQQFFIPLIYSSCSIDRIRVGKSKDGKLLIRNFYDQSGNLLFFAGGSSEETPYKFSYAEEYKGYIPAQKNGLWGYFDSSGRTIVPEKYDFACIFEQGVARVKLNSKWGLINVQGKEITPIIYDNISLIDTLQSPPIFRASIGEKMGVLATNGNEIIPVIYDDIGYSLLPDKLTAIRLGDKWGYAIRTEVVIPAIYSKICSYYGERALVKRDEIYYMVDIDGYEYETKGLWIMRDPIPNTKRKIQFDEQIVE